MSDKYQGGNFDPIAKAADNSPIVLSCDGGGAMTTLRQPRITLSGSTYIGEYEPGNGTRYTAVAIPWRATPDQVMGKLGFVSDGWLVVSGNSGCAYLFQRDGGILTDSYIMRLLGGVSGDYPYFGDLIRRLINRNDPPRHRDIDTIDEAHDLGLRDLTDPFTKEPY